METETKQTDRDIVDPLLTYNDSENNQLVCDLVSNEMQEFEPLPVQQEPLSAEKAVSRRLTDKEKALRLIHRARLLENKAMKLERPEKLCKAMLYYKRAAKLLPDVESTLYEDQYAELSEELSQDAELNNDIKYEKTEAAEYVSDMNDEKLMQNDFLILEKQRILAMKTQICEPQYPPQGAHFSWLPYDLVLVVLRWVVSTDQDAASLERVAAVCRGLYVAAREPDIWRSLCIKTWGINCSTPRELQYSSWRAMYIERPRVNLDGVYICQTSYDRLGEHAFVHSMTRPLYHIEYYRYFRFFPDGLVLLWTTTTEPIAAVKHLKDRHTNPSLRIWPGSYRLVDEKVVIVMQRTVESATIAQDNPRYKLKHHRYDAPPEITHQQTFLLELTIHNAQNGQPHSKLKWSRYSVRMNNKRWAQIEVQKTGGRPKFPALHFSRVRSYNEKSYAPLY